jgi:DNA-binding Lrp family transcriptional regulator
MNPGLTRIVTETERRREISFAFSRARERAAEIAKVQEVYIITGDWDLLIKLRAESVDTIG